MKYSNYSPEVIMSSKGYQEICNAFLKLAKTPETKSILESVLYQGGYKDYVPYGGIGRDNPGLEIQRRLSLAYLLIRNPESFNYIINNGINYFHGTRSVAIPSILENGLNSIDKSKEMNIEVTTGETWSRSDDSRSFVSFTDLLDLAESYAQINPKDNDFPVVFGTTKECIHASYGKSIGSDLPEVGVNGSFPKESIKIMMVPSDRIDMFKDLMPEGIALLAADGIGEKFYYVDECDEVHIINEKYQTLASKLYKSEKKTIFQRITSHFTSK